jgi:hypothetical protein
VAKKKSDAAVARIIARMTLTILFVGAAIAIGLYFHRRTERANEELRRSIERLAEVTGQLNSAQARVAELEMQLADLRAQVEELKAAAADPSRMAQLEVERERALRERDRARGEIEKLSDQLRSLLADAQTKAGNGAVSEALESQMRAAADVLAAPARILQDGVFAIRPDQQVAPGEAWNHGPQNEMLAAIVQHPLALHLRYRLATEYSGWTLRFPAENWMAYQGWVLVIRLVSPTDFPEFKLDLDAGGAGFPGFSTKILLSQAAREQLERQKYIEVRIPLRNLRNDSGVSATAGNALSAVAGLAMVVERKHTESGELTIESIRLFPGAELKRQ